MKRIKHEFRAQIETRARALARTGKYSSFRTVQNALLDGGFPEVERLFKNRWQQEEISRLCRHYFRIEQQAPEENGPAICADGIPLIVRGAGPKSKLSAFDQ
jgi:hypothetical protein